MNAVLLIIVAGLALESDASLGPVTKECSVSLWESWGPCIGNCDFALRVRNRDVQSSPFPKQKDEMWIIQPCPQLYQVVACTPNFCDANGNPQRQRSSNLTIADDFLGPAPIVDHLEPPLSSLPRSNRRVAESDPVFGSGGELAPLIVLPQSSYSHDTTRATAESRTLEDIVPEGRRAEVRRRRPLSTWRRRRNEFSLATTMTPRPTTTTTAVPSVAIVDKVLNDFRPSLVWSSETEDRLFEESRQDERHQETTTRSSSQPRRTQPSPTPSFRLGSFWEATPAWTTRRARFQNYRSPAIPRRRVDLRATKKHLYQAVPRAALVVGAPRARIQTSVRLLGDDGDARHPFSFSRRFDSNFWRDG